MPSQALFEQANGTFIAGEAIALYDVVTYETDEQIDKADATDELNAIGVAMNAAAAQGDSVLVATAPGQKVPVVASAAIAVGVRVMPDAGTPGRVITHTTTLCSLGIALQAATDAGDVIQILLDINANAV